MKGKQFYLPGSISGIVALIFVISIGCSKEEVGIPTEPNPDAGHAKLISEIEITQNAFEPTLSIKEVGVADPETGELLSPEAQEIISGIAYNIVAGSCSATNVGGQYQTCCQLNITNSTGGSISSVILVGDSAVSGNPSAYRTTGSGTGYDGSGTGWGNVSASNGGWALWMVRGASGNVIANGQSSDNRTICLQSPSGYSVSRWRLWRDAILIKLIDRDNNSAITSGTWAMLGVSSPDNTNFSELGNGNYVQGDSQGNLGFPYLGTTVTNFTITVGATNYARQTIFGTTNRNITFYLKSRVLRGRVAVGNYNNTLANVLNTPSTNDDANPEPTVTSPCTATGNLGCEGWIRIGVMLPAMGYEDIYNLSLEALVGPEETEVAYASTGTCNVTLTPLSLDVLPSNIILPYQNEYPLTALGYSNAAMRVSKYEWWVPAPQNTNNVTVSNIWGILQKSAIESLLSQTTAGGPVNIASLVTRINPQCTGWRRNITTGTLNLQGQSFSINKTNNLSSLQLTLQNLPTTPTTTYSRSVLGIMGVEFQNNPASYQKLSAISLAGNTVSTTPSTNVLLPSSNSLAADEYLIPFVLVADLDKNANTWDASAVVAIADRPGKKTYSSTTINTFFSIPSLAWGTINSNNRRVAYANPERNIGQAGGSPWVDVGVGVISKSSFINQIIEEGVSCAVGAGCCKKQQADGSCIFDQEGPENLWEFLMRGRTSSTSGPLIDWTIPDLPASVDLPVGNPTNYPDGNYPSLTVANAAWCPGSSLCTANATSNEFGFDTNGSINDVLNNTTHFGTNKFNLGGVRIINPPNQYATTTSPVTVNGFVDAGNWDVVSCDRVYVETWQTWTSGTSTGEECGTCPTGTACGNTTVNPDCPATHCCSSSLAMTPLTAAGGCSASLPSYCFTLSLPISNNRWRHIEISPRLGGSFSNTCGAGSGEWYIRMGNP